MLFQVKTSIGLRPSGPWKEIRGYNGAYIISPKGIIASLASGKTSKSYQGSFYFLNWPEAKERVSLSYEGVRTSYKISDLIKEYWPDKDEYNLDIDYVLLQAKLNRLFFEQLDQDNYEQFYEGSGPDRFYETNGMG